MPPKSSNKKSQVSWFACDRCQIIITAKDRDGHEKNCSTDGAAISTFDYMLEHRLFTSNFNKKSFGIDELNDAPQKYINNLIFVSEGAMKLCGFRTGYPIAIRSQTKPELPTIVRIAWPILEKFLSTVFVCSEDYEENWQDYINTQLILGRLPCDIIPAKQVCLSCTSASQIEKTSMHDVKLLLKKQMKDLIFTTGSRVVLKFYNKRLEFVVRSCSSLCDTNPLESEFEKLRLGELFFSVVNSSLIEVERMIKSAVSALPTESHSVRVSKDDIGGSDEQMQQIEESLSVALGLRTVPSGVKLSRAMLLFGPTGCGKTMVCEAIANSCTAQVIRINTSELFSKFLGETEKNLSQQFEAAYRNYPKPTLIIIEDVHNLCPKHETNEVTKRVSVAFVSILDHLSTRPDASKVFVLATTGNIESLNAGARRYGRFDCEVEIAAPSPKARLQILQRHLSKVGHELDVDSVEEMASVTHGFVGSDLTNLIYSASLSAVKSGRTKIRSDDISFALSQVKPSAMREVLIENPNVKWTDIGGQDDLKLKLKQAIEWPLLHPEKFTRLGIKPPRGILMFGPPGCSKTMIAKALATESKVNFLSIKGPELFSMWVGESERAVREVFRKARQVAPSIVFFDEIDAIGGERSPEGGGTSVKERVLTQLLTELDGVDVLKNVTIVAATNRPDMIDKALLRPGRIDRIVYVGLPDTASRREIFRIKLRNMPLADDVDVEQLVARTEGYTGAEIQALCHEAALKILEENFDAQFVSWAQFEYAMKAVQPRTNSELLKLYDNYLKQS